MLTHIFTADSRDGIPSSEATDFKTVNASGLRIIACGGSRTQNGELLKVKSDTTNFTVTFIDSEGACGKACPGQGSGEVFISNVGLVLIDIIATGVFQKEAAHSETGSARSTFLTPFVTALRRCEASSVARAIHSRVVLTLAVFIFESNNRKKTEG